MTQTIQRLTDHTINQIAAGEVIESPASVVKELVENSIDAGSTSIIIEIKGGGLGQITISDNGKGMGRHDAELCVERHATSKILDVEDLFEIQTMGFRGEALASIASISKLTLITSLGEREGTRIEVAASKILEVESAPRARGTTIDVRSLFYNVPARKKFQKSTPRLLADINKVVIELSLAHPFISFELRNEGKRTLFAAPEQEVEGYLLRRCQTVLGDPFGATGFRVDFQEGGISLKGILGSPSDGRPNRLGQHLFINARAVTCPSLSFAVKEGFGTRLEPNRFPLFVLHLTLPPHQLDVNVHPQKKEVRLKDEALLKALVMRAVSQSLAEVQIPTTTEPPRSFSMCEETIHHTPFRPSTEGLRFKEVALPPQTKLELPPPPIEPIGLYRSYLLLDGANLEPLSCEGLVLVDLLAVRARLLFDTLQKPDKKMASQSLMFPITLSFSTLEMAQIISDLSLLEQCGFELRPIGETSLLIEAHPPFLAEDKLKDIILDLSTIKERERKLASVASRLARSGKKRFTQIEAVRLYEDLQKSSDPNHCPLGKRICVQWSHIDLERLF